MKKQSVSFDPDAKPTLIVAIDAEEDFNWSVFSRENVGVKSMQKQESAQKLHNSFGLKPIYLADFPVISQEDGYLPLLEFMKDGLCEIGSQLHPWVTPPFREDVTLSNTYLCNLPRKLAFEKISRHDETFAKNLGFEPEVFRCGRYGVNETLLNHLDSVGYKVDMSIQPRVDLTQNLGPDFREFSSHPFWLTPEKDLLGIPLTVGFTGLLASHGPNMHPRLKRKIPEKLHIPGVLARSGLLNRVALSPEGNTLSEAIALTLRHYRNGHRIFVVSYHAPSLVPGNTPYVQSQKDLGRFLDWFKGYFEFFFGRLAGVASTPMEQHATLQKKRKSECLHN